MSIPRKIIASSVVVVVMVIGAAAYWFLRDDAPAEASLDTAVAAVEEESAGDGDTSSTEAAEEEASGVEGTWTVDAETGDFTYESATGTFAGFRIAEELSTIGSTTAVGRTGDVSGEATIDGTTLTEATFDIDLTTITTETTLRDDAVQDALETGEFPTATFSLTEPVELPDGAADGGTIEVTAAGELTMHGVTTPIELAIEAQMVDDTIVLVATTEFAFTEHGVSVPESPVILSVDDVATLEAQILLVR